MDQRRRRDEDSHDFPTYSRLFVVCDKSLTEDDIRDVFREFGEIEDIKVPRDRSTGNPKGVAYVKYHKTSEAAKALAAMRGKPLGPSKRPIKVMVACNRSDIQQDNENDDEKYKRIFINIPKTANEDILEEEFSKFGEIQAIQIQRDRETRECKGFAYVIFRKFEEAAIATENCNKSYRAIFAQPRGFTNRRPETSYVANLNDLATSTANVKTSLLSMMNTRPAGYKLVHFMCTPYLVHHQVESLFNLIPGMVYCEYFVDLVQNFGKGSVQYSNPVSAAYAVEKLNRFEYPPGQQIFVKPDQHRFDAQHKNSFDRMPGVVNKLRNAIAGAQNSATPDLAQLAEAIAEASKLIKVATAGATEDNIPDSNDLNYCSVKLPPPQPLADIDATMAKRCFLVCQPQPPPLTVLRDIFCRFGDLINVYTLPNKTVGYARYASIEGADRAIKALHGAEICGVRMKVLEAEEEQHSKRMRYD